MNNDRTIAITGVGAISAAGNCPAEIWDNACSGNSPAKRYPSSDERWAVPACSVSTSSLVLDCMPRAEKMDRSVQLALHAAAQAIGHAGLDASVSPKRVGIVAGTSRGPIEKVAEMMTLVRDNRRPPPSLAAYATIASLSGAISLAFEARGPCLTVSATCASAGHAIALAAQQVLLGTADVMLAGGADAPLHPAVIKQLLSTGILGSHVDPARACRPFDQSRNGTVLGEGAAFLVLESLSAARRRGARIQGVLAGWAIGTDSDHYASPREDGEGLHHVMSQAVALAGLDPQTVDYVNTHGTGTKLNDEMEVTALRRFFGERLPRVPISSTKPITGHCLGATPALEAVLCILALQRQTVPPTINCVDIDPGWPIDVVPRQARRVSLRAALSNSLGFWGNNAALVFTAAPPL
jgi:3-oxoacyl-[acyl-carrier-protein] synthase II